MSDKLERAYAIRTPDDARKLYRDWARSYDDDFTRAHGYVAPQRIAEIFRDEADGDEPVLDVGAGTGAVAEHLKGVAIDGLDISPEMLAVAKKKGLYRRRIVADLTKPLDLPDASYGGVVSAGTFTHGHVGPGCLPGLVRVTRPGALFVCGTNPQVFDRAGFGSAVASLVADGAITPVKFRWINFYALGGHDHKNDRGLVMVFRKT